LPLLDRPRQVRRRCARASGLASNPSRDQNRTVRSLGRLPSRLWGRRRAPRHRVWQGPSRPDHPELFGPMRKGKRLRRTPVRRGQELQRLSRSDWHAQRTVHGCVHKRCHIRHHIRAMVVSVRKELSRSLRAECLQRTERVVHLQLTVTTRMPGCVAGETAQYELARLWRDSFGDLDRALAAFKTQRSRFPNGALRTEAALSRMRSPRRRQTIELRDVDTVGHRVIVVRYSSSFCRSRPAHWPPRVLVAIFCPPSPSVSTHSTFPANRNRSPAVASNWAVRSSCQLVARGRDCRKQNLR
jgi:hypothetical protein